MKKGSVQLAEEAMKMFPRVFFTGIVLGIFFLIIGIYLNRQVETEHFEHFLLTQRLLYSPQCFSLEEGRTYPGIIDLRKFDEARISSCASKEGTGYRLTLLDVSGALVKKVDVNPELTGVLGFCGIKHKNFVCEHTRAFVLINDRGTISNGFLDIETVIKDA